MNVFKREETKGYYSNTEILKAGCLYNLLIGERSNGKSYTTKYFLIKNAYELGNKFIYLRRRPSELKQRYVDEYFSDMPVKDLTKGEYVGITGYQGYLYFCKDQDGKWIREKEIGRYCELEHSMTMYKSQNFMGYSDIDFEEFITGESYLPDETSLLQNFISTVFRREEGRVWLIGNTVTKFCPYFSEWGLNGIKNQKVGTIDVYKEETGIVDEKTGDPYYVKIAVERTDGPSNKSRMMFGKAAKSINFGEWDLNSNVPILPGKLEDYECVYELLFKDRGNYNYVMQLLVDLKTGGQFIYVYPYTKNRIIKRTISNIFSTDPFTTSCFSDKIKAEIKICELFHKDKICFCDVRTGTDFQNMIKSWKGVL